MKKIIFIILLLSFCLDVFADENLVWPNGHWTGRGHHTQGDVDLWGCNLQRCFYKISIKPVGSKYSYSGHDGEFVRSKLEMAPKYPDDLRYQSIDIRFKLDQAKKLVHFQSLGCKSKCTDFPQSAEEYDLEYVGPATVQLPSFDCAKTRTKYESWACQFESIARDDKDLNFEFSEYLNLAREESNKSKIKDSQSSWFKDFSRLCETGDRRICEKKLHQRVLALRQEKASLDSCQHPSTYFQSILCEKDALGLKLQKWNDLMVDIENKEKKGIFLYSKAGFYRNKFNSQTCKKESLEEVRSCLLRDLEKLEAVLAKAKISEDDWGWLQTWDGKQSNDLGESDINFIKKMMLTKMIKPITDRLSGPPNDIDMKDQRYITITGCMAHACTHEALIWIDIKEKVVISAYGESINQWARCEAEESKVHVGSAQFKSTDLKSAVEFQKVFDVWSKNHCKGDHPIFSD